MTTKIELTQEKINIANRLIKSIEYNAIYGKCNTSEMLQDTINVCKELLLSDF